MNAPAESRPFDALYSELRGVADRLMAEERGSHTLQPTALVHEVWLKLGREDLEFHDQSHLLATMVQAMRRVLVDHARGRAAEKRGGGLERVAIDSRVVGLERGDIDLIELDDLLEGLRSLDPRKAQVAELRLFGGLEFDEIARSIGVSRSTAADDWSVARAWLAGRIEP